MTVSCHDFYKSRSGRIIRRVLKQRIAEFWEDDDIAGRHVACFGYAAPYVGTWRDHASRLLECSSFEQDNIDCMAYDGEMPLSAEAINKLLLIHHFEFSHAPQLCLKEAWRVLKPGGKILCVVPNRHGFWAHADKTPFGQGMPYSLFQIKQVLQQHHFEITKTKEALYIPPYKATWNLRLAGLYEYCGRFLSFLPIAAGVHIVEAEKKIREPILPKGNAPVVDMVTKKLMRPKPV